MDTPNVHPQVGLACKPHVTFGTLVRLYSGMDIHVVLKCSSHNKPLFTDFTIKGFELFFIVASHVPSNQEGAGHVAALVTHSSLMCSHMPLHSIRVFQNDFAARVGARYFVIAVCFVHVLLKVPDRKVLPTNFAHFFLLPFLDFTPTLAFGHQVVSQLVSGVKPGLIGAMPALVLNIAIMLFRKVLLILCPSLGLKVWAYSALSIVVLAMVFVVHTEQNGSGNGAKVYKKVLFTMCI